MASVGTFVVATQHHQRSTDSLQGTDRSPTCESHASRAQCRLDQRCTRRQATHLAALISASVALVACTSSKRTELNQQQLNEVSAADLADSGNALQLAVGKVLGRIERKIESESEADDTLNFLAMSGGGDYGAFGAGFLVGWGSAPRPEWNRPEFDVVTGVSTGALLAPFAFLGTDESCLAVESFYRNPSKDWLRDRGMLFFLPWNPSFMVIPGLERDVRAAVNAEFIAKLAAESRKGRVLAVSATDLDLGRQKFWDVSAEAEKATDPEGVDRVQRMLLASAAIPAVFPPIEIGDSVYADGGVTANVLLKLDPRNPTSLIPRWNAAHPHKPLPRVRYWIIVNSQLSHRPKTVQAKWPRIVGPSLETSIRSATIAEIRWLAAEADYVNIAYGTHIEVRVVAIPNDWQPPVEGQFKKETMASLADLGRKMGADPTSWRVWAMPAHAIQDASPQIESRSAPR